MRKFALLLAALMLLILAIVPVVAQDATIVDTAATGPAYVRFAHLAPGNAPMDFIINGSARSNQKGIEYGKITGWFWVEAGTTEIVISPSGRNIKLFGGPITLDLVPGQRVTLAITGAVFDGGALKLNQIEEDYEGLDEGNARVTVFHAIEGAPEVNVIAGGDTVTPLVYRLAYPGSKGENDGVYTLDVPAGTYDLAVVPFDSTEPLLEMTEATLSADTYYFAVAAGTADEPTIIIATTSGN